MKMTTNLWAMLGPLVVATLMTAPLSRAALTVDVYALNNSSSGGSPVSTISLTAGQLFTVTVNPNDLWNAGALPRWSNADGLTHNFYANGHDESGKAAGTLIGQNYGTWTQNGFTAPYGALVGKIGATYMLIGTTWINKPAPASGTLQLMYWDSNNGDNTDKITAITATIIPVPEPSTFLAGALLALPLGLRAIRTLRNGRRV